MKRHVHCAAVFLSLLMGTRTWPLTRIGCAGTASNTGSGGDPVTVFTFGHRMPTGGDSTGMLMGQDSSLPFDVSRWEYFHEPDLP
ncbi:hypothetical protein [Desulfosarcina alkanivorans]|uniref:hypothetical protein n=1 Tax=Desulfosarcina alkanivorans TaxID=571177 RepID=UPI0012D2F566|nr:hypothetical protein [Desulfosarcina alkanivorans]